jgi:hypothetical protein
MDRFKILKEIVVPAPFIEKTVDKTTLPRFEYAFDKEREIREGYHSVCDSTLEMSEDLKKQVETMVTDWLDGHGVEAFQLEIKYKNAAGEFITPSLFQRSEIALKTACNNWEIYHIAKSGDWPRILSSKPKLLIQRSSGDFIKLKNEIKSVDFETINQAQRMLNDFNNESENKIENISDERS